MEVKSKENPIYKELKKISKENSNYIFIEGKKLFIEALNSKIRIEKVYIDEQNQSLFSELLSNHRYELIFMDNDLLSSVFTTDNKPTSDDLIIALAEKPNWQSSDLIKTKKNLILLEEIQDPGNLGTILRSALAFNAGGIILTSDSVDPFNTKVIRASAGAVFKMPVVVINDFKSVLDFVKKEKYKIVATLPASNKHSSKVPLPHSRTLFLFGNEGRGLSTKLLNLSDETVSISHSKEIESLNLGVAVSIVLWKTYKEVKDLSRLRRDKSDPSK